MPLAQWPLLRDRPIIEVLLTQAQGGEQVLRRLVADTGAGTSNSGFDLLLEEQDCLLCGGIPSQDVTLGGAYKGSYPIYLVAVQLPLLGFNQSIPVVGVPSVPAGFDGIACFQFLNRFTYGNSGDNGKFGLEL
jgi:hypothetical protein